jgi:hypothetical protein
VFRLPVAAEMSKLARLGDMLSQLSVDVRTAREGPTESGVRLSRLANLAGHIDRMLISPSGRVSIEGWAADVAGGRPVDLVLVLVDRRVVDITVPSVMRGDVAKALGSPVFSVTGFKSSFLLPVQPRPQCTITIIAVVNDRGGAELGGEQTSCARRP